MVGQCRIKAVFLDAAHTTLRLARPYPDIFLSGIKDFGLAASYGDVERVLVECWSRVEHRFNGEHEGDYVVDDAWDRRMWAGFYSMMLDELGITGYSDEIIGSIYRQFGMSTNWSLYPETIEAIKALKERGLFVGIGSNWDSSLPNVLAGLGVSQLLDASVISCQIGSRKPAAAFFAAECAAAGATAQEVMHVGDHPVADISGPRRMGMPCILVWRDSTPAPDCGVPVVKSLLEIGEVLDRMALQ
ncbi:MAG: HAD family hydrolase [Candidatus Brocadiia bacterium]